MFKQNLNNETKKLGTECKITIEEIRQFKSFKDTDDETLLELSEFVYYLSLILYKENNNETA